MMSIKRLKSTAHAAGYVMAVSEEYLQDEPQPHLLALEAPPAERPTYVPYKKPQPPVLLIEHHNRAASLLQNIIDTLRGGRPTVA